MVTVARLTTLSYLALRSKSGTTPKPSGIIIVFLFCHSNVECGQLQCMSGDFQANVGVDIIHSTSNQSGVSCRYDLIAHIM